MGMRVIFMNPKRQIVSQGRCAKRYTCSRYTFAECQLFEIEYRVGKDELAQLSSADIKKLRCLQEKSKIAHSAQRIVNAKLQKVGHHGG
jgi:hypothetical protein